MFLRIKNFLRDKILLKGQIDRFYQVFGGHILFQTLRTAVQLGIFDLLEQTGPLTRGEIAKQVNAPEQPIRIVLMGLVSVGLLKKRRDRYSNSYIARWLLVNSSPQKVTAYVELQHRVMYKGLYWMLESVRSGKNIGLQEFKGNEPTIYQRLAHDPETEQIFQKAMEELSSHANSDLQSRLNLAGVRHLVDVGGGNGTNAMALAGRWPHLKATVFDSPTVCELAKSYIAAKGMSGRVDVYPGNCFSDPFPEKADAYLFAHFFTIWGEQRDREILRKCYDSLPANGRVIIFNMMQNDNENGPLSAALGSPYFLCIATGLGMLHTWKEYETWILEAGFRKVERYKLARDHGMIVGIK